VTALRKPTSVAAILLLLTVAAAGQQSNAIGTSAFESYVDALRQQAGIPALSGALVQDGAIVWERGLGFANVEARIRATPDTPYAIADMSQAVAAVLLLQCVEQRHLYLDDPLRSYGVPVQDPDATLRQVLSHGATGAFRYDPERYAQLTTVMERCAPQSYRKSVAHRVLEFLAMIDSVPGTDLQNASVVPEGLFDPSALQRYARSLERIAVPYRVDKKNRATRNDLVPAGINTATGLVSTVRDLAQFDAALDSGRLLQQDTLEAAFSQQQGRPTGLGWFVQSYRGVPVVWQFGMVPNAYSSLIVKVPSRHATMILLANSDGLVSPFQLESGDVTRSLFASVFLRMLL
jgi:CubicO group peptidase (beta-lactamase class C family)